MTETQRIQDDLQFVRQAVAKRDAPYSTPGGILLIWAAYVLVGYTLLDFNRVYAGTWFMIAGMIGGIGSGIIGKRHAARIGEIDHSDGMKQALHWGSIVLAIVAILALFATRHDEIRGRGEVIGQVIAICVGIVYFLAGVHFDRYFIWLGLMLMAGAVAISFVPQYGWTMLGVLLSAGLALPVVLRRRSDVPSVQ
ncbi:MAG: hypothetical protein H7Z14_14670 [Anaerolineae bacterium]|nr:hypothetical protein [Phycisphaerae bacterium]